MGRPLITMNEPVNDGSGRQVDGLIAGEFNSARMMHAGPEIAHVRRIGGGRFALGRVGEQVQGVMLAVEFNGQLARAGRLKCDALAGDHRDDPARQGRTTAELNARRAVTSTATAPGASQLAKAASSVWSSGR